MVLAAPASAQQAQPSASSQPMPFFRAMDTDNDGAVTQQEFMAGHQKRQQNFSAVDQNNDGIISRDEFMQAGQQRRQARFQELDRDNNGQLTAEELQQHTVAMFRAMDGNSDGRITPEEVWRKRGKAGPGPGMMQQQGRMPPEDMPMGQGWGQR
jgi:Ca2+-binding EF-hand superfamily protein